MRKTTGKHAPNSAYSFFLNGSPKVDFLVRLALEDFRAEMIMRRGQK
jgi:hypothetical protein